MSDNVVPIFDRAEVIARRTILAALDELNADELCAVAELVTKLVRGSEEHGHIDFETDTRDFDAERSEEALDWLWYHLFSSIKRRRGK